MMNSSLPSFSTTMILEPSESEQRSIFQTMQSTQKVAKKRKTVNDFSVIAGSSPMLQLSSEDKEVVVSRAKMLELKNKLKINATTYKKALKGERLKPLKKRLLTIPIPFNLRSDKRAMQYRKYPIKPIDTNKIQYSTRILPTNTKHHKNRENVKSLTNRTKILADKSSNDKVKEKRVKAIKNNSLLMGRNKSKEVKGRI